MSPLINRRQVLQRGAHGFGWLALNAMLAGAAPGAKPHFRPRAKNVILLFMDGGVSHVDSFDPKPLLQKENGQPFKMKVEATQFDANGHVLASPWKFKPYGQSGIPVSELFPCTGSVIDDICVIRSMKVDFPEHAQATLMLHCGHPLQGRPSMGSWLSYGLGSENQNLPSYAVVSGGMVPLGGVENFGSGFLPATHQASTFDAFSGGEPIPNITPRESPARQLGKLDFVASADQAFLKSLGHADAAVDAAIRNYETAFAMQSAVPELTDIRGESEITKKLYGLDATDKLKSQYGRQLLMARRMVERGVRCVEVGYVRGIRNVAPWDQHGSLVEHHAHNAYIVDQAIAALLTDLKSRGLLDSTLVIWAGEFGRTPFAQGLDGRDHNPQGFTIWMAGGGVKGGMTYGATDEYGYKAVEDMVTMHDLHATILHLMGINHKKLTFEHGGRDYRLTDVHGEVLQKIVA
ncbi:MAG TPA: DUF1501 domain-containing protein [Candidatus Saccharimonadia bacterium]|nr:DUF1501 domain-containing protein [Candidatus Saccharimonadia bacterium]